MVHTIDGSIVRERTSDTGFDNTMVTPLQIVSTLSFYCSYSALVYSTARSSETLFLEANELTGRIPTELGLLQLGKPNTHYRIRDPIACLPQDDSSLTLLISNFFLFSFSVLLVRPAVEANLYENRFEGGIGFLGRMSSLGECVFHRCLVRPTISPNEFDVVVVVVVVSDINLSDDYVFFLTP